MKGKSNIKEMLQNKEIIVPAYQRAYSWDTPQKGSEKKTQVDVFIKDIEEYIKGHDITEESTTPDREERMNEYVMLRFRLCEGIDTAVFESRFGASFEEMYGKKLAPFVASGLVKQEGGRYSLSQEGMLVSNAILSDILDFASQK
jgi:coproporphyrinogen III oxidase-like Fe-S oxidoreductase